MENPVQIEALAPNAHSGTSRITQTKLEYAHGKQEMT